MSRDCVKAGSWYSGSSPKLNGMLENWLEGCKTEVDTKLQTKCLIGPHAGYRHCGATLSRAFKNVNPAGIKTVFILGPSHKFRFKDVGVRREENEHSIEMHLPFVYKIFGNQKIKIVPIMVSHFDESHSPDAYAKLLHPFFQRDDIFFCVSSDFCHWGPRFRFTHRFSDSQTIGSSIEKLDKLGVEAISSKSIEVWNNYVEKYRNTICGRRAISIILELLEIEKGDQNGRFDGLVWKLVGYHQSNKNVTEDETSVSYASCVLYNQYTSV